MPRATKRKPPRTGAVVTLEPDPPDAPPIIFHPPAKAKEEDPYATLPGQVEPRNVTPLDTSHDAQRKRYIKYAQALVRSGGDPLFAICETLNISEDEAKANLEALHERLIADGGQNPPLDMIFKRMNVGLPVRVAVLKHHLFSPIPAASLKAEERLSEIEGKNALRNTGVRAEDLIYAALGKMEADKKAAG
jgi:hypothetical protein